MRYNGSKRVLSALLVAVMMLGLLPAMTIDSHAAFCPECSEQTDGAPYTCLGCMEICPSHELCIECAIGEGVHCQNCEACDEEVVICEECGEVCSACASEMCENCNPQKLSKTYN